MNNQFPSDSPFYEEHHPDQTQLFNPGLQEKKAAPESNVRQFTDEDIFQMTVSLHDALAELDEQIGQDWMQEAMAFINEALEILTHG